LFERVGTAFAGGVRQITSAWNAPEDGNYYCLLGEGVLIDYGKFRDDMSMTWWDYVIIILVLASVTATFSHLIIRNDK
jgi:hypothetical protein